MAAAKKCIGTIKCYSCGVEIPARVNDNNTLDLGCGYCDYVGYAKDGTEAHATALTRINKKEAEKPAPAPVKKLSAGITEPEKPAPVPVKKPLSFVDLLNGVQS